VLRNGVGSEPLRSGTLDAAHFIKRELYPPQLR